MANRNMTFDKAVKLRDALENALGLRYVVVNDELGYKVVSKQRYEREYVENNNLCAESGQKRLQP